MRRGHSTTRRSSPPRGSPTQRGLAEAMSAAEAHRDGVHRLGAQDAGEVRELALGALVEGLA